MTDNSQVWYEVEPDYDFVVKKWLNGETGDAVIVEYQNVGPWTRGARFYARLIDDETDEVINEILPDQSSAKPCIRAARETVGLDPEAV